MEAISTQLCTETMHLRLNIYFLHRVIYFQFLSCKEIKVAIREVLTKKIAGFTVLRLQELMPDSNEGHGESASEEKDEHGRQFVAVFDAERQRLKPSKKQ